jgi:regulatory protein
VDGSSAPPRSKRALDLKEARRVAYALLSRKAWTSQELLVRLRRRGAPAELARIVIAGLERQRYLDDEAYAYAWAEGRARHRHLGGRRIRQELAKKGVPRPFIDAAVERVFGDEGERAEALIAARARWATLEKRSPDKAPRRLQQYLLRLGFSEELTRGVVKQISQSVDVQSDA